MYKSDIIRKFIEEGKLKEALDHMPINKNTSLLKARFSRIKDDICQGVVSEEEARIEYNRINTALLSLLDNKTPVIRHLKYYKIMVVFVFISVFCVFVLKLVNSKKNYKNDVAQTWKNSIEMEFVLIPAGHFLMGSPLDDKDANEDEKPQHKVEISKKIYVGKYEVTQKQWEAVMEKNESWFKGANRPVDYLSWYKIKEFIKKLNDKEGTSTYRLPSEAEWEYVARAGAGTKYTWGNHVGENNANCNGCGSEWDNKETAPVGSFSPNAWGLYDVHGNVWEWVEDIYDKNAYSQKKVDEGNNQYRVVRGGSWNAGPQKARLAFRYDGKPFFKYQAAGFRLVKEVD